MQTEDGKEEGMPDANPHPIRSLPDYFRIIPLEMNSKIPLNKDWSSKAVAPSHLAPFFLERHNFGVACGPSGLVVLDFDIEKPDIDPKAIDLCNDLQDRYPQTPLVQTRSGGFHIYFREPGGVSLGNGRGALPRGVDVRGRGGQVVIPPSSVDGKPYTWIVFPPPDIADIPELPKDIVKMIQGHGSKGRKSSSTPPVTGSLTKTQKSLLFDTATAVREARPGDRNTTLFEQALKCAKARIPQKMTHKSLMPAALHCGLDERESERTIKSAYKTEVAQRAQERGADVNGYNDLKPRLADCVHVPGRLARIAAVLVSLGECKELGYIPATEEWYMVDKNGEKRLLGRRNVGRVAITKLLYSRFMPYYTMIDNMSSAETPEERRSLNSATWFKAAYSIKPLDARSATSEYRCLEQYLAVLDNASMKRDVVATRCGDKLVNTGDGSLSDVQGFAPRRLGVEWQGYDAPCPKWQEFLDGLVDPEMGALLQRVVGASITGRGPEVQKAVFLIGPGANGKSTFLQVIAEVLGGYGVRANERIFNRNSDSSYYVASLYGVRFAYLEEMRAGMMLNSTFKDIVTAKVLEARPPYEKPYTFDNQVLMFFAGNSMPVSEDSSEGSFRRLIIVRCDKKPERQVPGLARKLVKEEGPGILAWIMKGARDYMEMGLDDVIEVANKDLERYQENENRLKSFFAHMGLNPDPKAKSGIPVKYLYKAYKHFVQEAGMRPYARNRFVQEISTVYGRDTVSRISARSRLYEYDKYRVKCSFFSGLWSKYLGPQDGEMRASINFFGETPSDLSAQLFNLHKVVFEHLVWLKNHGKLTWYNIDDVLEDDDDDEEMDADIGMISLGEKPMVTDSEFKKQMSVLREYAARRINDLCCNEQELRQRPDAKDVLNGLIRDIETRFYKVCIPAGLACIPGIFWQQNAWHTVKQWVAGEDMKSLTQELTSCLDEAMSKGMDSVTDDSGKLITEQTVNENRHKGFVECYKRLDLAKRDIESGRRDIDFHWLEGLVEDIVDVFSRIRVPIPTYGVWRDGAGECIDQWRERGCDPRDVTVIDGLSKVLTDTIEDAERRL